MILQVKKKTITGGEGTSTSRVCLMAQGNKKPIPSDSDNDSDSDDELPSYNEIVQEILNMLRFALANKRSLLCCKKN